MSCFFLATMDPKFKEFKKTFFDGKTEDGDVYIHFVASKSFELFSQLFYFSKSIRINFDARNRLGQTAIDVAKAQFGDKRVEELLQKAWESI